VFVSPVFYNYSYRITVTTNKRSEQTTIKVLIGHFSTAKPWNILTADILRMIGTVDHYMVFCITKLNARKFRKKKTGIIETRNLSKYEKTPFRNGLSMIDWQPILDPVSENPNAMALTFQGIFELVLDMRAPLIEREFLRILHHG